MAHAQLASSASIAVVGQTLSDEPLLRQIARYEGRAPLQIAHHRALSAELEESAIVDPGDNKKKALQTSQGREALRKGFPSHDLVNYHEKSATEAAVGIPEPT